MQTLTLDWPRLTPAQSARLDHPVWHALTSGHARMAQGQGRARRYPAEVSPFAAVEAPDPEAFADLRALAQPGDRLALTTAAPVNLPSGWRLIAQEVIHQMVSETPVSPVVIHGARWLTAADTAEALALVAEAKPGPFGTRTLSTGRYLGLDDGYGRLIAMTGERMDLGDMVELSAVATANSHRGLGLGGKFVRAVTAAIAARGHLPFLHVRAENPARHVYARCGFRLRAELYLTVIIPEG